MTRATARKGRRKTEAPTPTVSAPWRSRIVGRGEVTPAELIPHPSNWRQHPEAQQRALAGLLDQVGWVQDVVVNRRTGHLVDGHLRVDLARSRGEATMPVVYVDLDEAEEALVLASLDPLAAMATADPAKLEALLREAQVSDAALRAMLDELAERSGVGADAKDGLTDPDDVPEPPEKAVTEKGDLWILGDHRLLCGDATRPEDVDRLMGGQRAALVATDPPYLVDYTGERPNDSGKDWSDRYREVEIQDAEGFFRSVFQNVLRVLAPRAALYCWHAHKRCGLIQRIWEDLGILDHQQVVWVKPTAAFGRVYWHFRHEPCAMGWVKGQKPEHDGNHEHDSVWEVDWEGKARIAGPHPTQKPVELFARPMRKHTRPGDFCFEPFSGSGSQLIAGERLGRRVFAMEVEPLFVDAAVLRWEEFTGKKAERVPAPSAVA